MSGKIDVSAVVCVGLDTIETLKKGDNVVIAGKIVLIPGDGIGYNHEERTWKENCQYLFDMLDNVGISFSDELSTEDALEVSNIRSDLLKDIVPAHEDGEDILSSIRFEGLDQNPGGIRDIVSMAFADAKRYRSMKRKSREREDRISDDTRLAIKRFGNKNKGI